jgi:hypothetical protein
VPKSLQCPRQSISKVDNFLHHWPGFSLFFQTTAYCGLLKQPDKHEAATTVEIWIFSLGSRFLFQVQTPVIEICGFSQEELF